ncbi:MAG: UDP-N-acetylmuramoyl-L-alanine--D-glutamate ligase [Chloroflexi bacterium]|nr:UDP-N-acetylmuramoyl-L-alanine--D-glutamate ligase [Chloroflexota bacterium]
MELRGKKVTVMGLGVHGGGLGVARYCAEQGAVVTVTDLRTPELLRESIDALADLPITFVLGEHRECDFAECDIVVQNPAVPATSPYVAIARAAGAAVEMEMTLFFRQCPAPIIGITGSKGKTTTATLTAHLLRSWRSDTVLAGNMRISALAQLATITPNTLVVLELSSFVLEGLDGAGLSPHVAAITNIHPDHLDRYGTMEPYIAAKAAIGRHQRPSDVLVLLDTDPVLQHLAHTMPGQICWSGVDAPRQRTVGSAWWYDDALLVATHDGVVHVASRRDVQMNGRHHLANVAMAVALAVQNGMPLALIAGALRSFTGVEHRQERVAEHAGHTFINDTAATMPDAAIVALECMPKPIIWIAGGADKKLDFTQLAAVAHAHVANVVLLQGTATARLEQALCEAGLGDRIVGVFDTFDGAIRHAHALNVRPATILLSPGCASFGMFRNEFHRGEEFRRIVAQLCAEES